GPTSTRCAPSCRLSSCGRRAGCGRPRTSLDGSSRSSATASPGGLHPGSKMEYTVSIGGGSRTPPQSREGVTPMRHPYAAGREAIQFTFTLGEDPVLAEAIALAQKDVDEEFGPGQLVVTGFGENGEVLCQVDTPSD